MAEKAKLLIVDRWQLTRDSLARACRRRFAIVTSEVEPEAALAGLSETQPDVLLLDMDHRARGLPELCQRFLRQRPQLRIATFISEITQYAIYRAFNCPVQGIISKLGEGQDRVVKALEDIAAGRTFFSDDVMELRTKMQRDPGAFYKILSDRELELLPSLCSGSANEAIGKDFRLRPSTVLWHRRNVMRKLNVHAATELVLYGLKLGMLPCDGFVRPRYFDDKGATPGEVEMER